jgi:hypothetical protein
MKKNKKIKIGKKMGKLLRHIRDFYIETYKCDDSETFKLTWKRLLRKIYRLKIK